AEDQHRHRDERHRRHRPQHLDRELHQPREGRNEAHQDAEDKGETAADAKTADDDEQGLRRAVEHRAVEEGLVKRDGDLRGRSEGIALNPARPHADLPQQQDGHGKKRAFEGFHAAPALMKWKISWRSRMNSGSSRVSSWLRGRGSVTSKICAMRPGLGWSATTRSPR